MPTPPVFVNGDETDLDELARRIRDWGTELGFAAIGITGIDPGPAEQRLEAWLEAGHHGDMDYMARHGRMRSRPGLLLPGTVRVISARMDHLPRGAAAARTVLADPQRAYVARYALGRDYHKTMRQRLARLAARISAAAPHHACRVYSDSAPILEKPFAAAAGLGWIGKHSLLINRHAGSWFLLGEICTNLPLPVDAPATAHCGSCHACIDVCPTRAIVAPHVVDARRCISYLTIESAAPIPAELRPAIGNRIFGCDDCQLHCPWNKFARHAPLADFDPRHGLDAALLVDLFAWDHARWETATNGSALRRAGHEGWLRNIAVALGNAPRTAAVIAALEKHRNHPSALVREHVHWALARHGVSVPGDAATG